MNIHTLKGDLSGSPFIGFLDKGFLDEGTKTN
jgi:hypothetical protein